MSGEVLSAGLGGHGVSVGCSRGGVVSRFLLVVCVAAVLLLGVSSVASAASFYWYGENNSTCWQTGQPGSSSSACDGVGEYFLNSSNPPRMLGGAASTDVELASGSGDYCNAYDIGETLSHTDEIDQSSWTGISPPSPYGKWQQDDASGTVCQAIGSTWGQEIRGAANSECKGAGHEPCGMQHYVSLQSQQDRPWSSSFGSPSLVITSQANPETATVSGGAWGYICPLLRQGTTNKVLEFCWEQWRIGTGFPGTNTNFDVSAACANTTNFIFDQTITDYASNTKFATEMAGSANTFVFEKNPSTRTFTGYITEANLDAAIKATNEHCGAGYSEVPSEYVLVGIEQGMEGGHLWLSCHGCR